MRFTSNIGTPLDERSGRATLPLTTFGSRRIGLGRICSGLSVPQGIVFVRRWPGLTNFGSEWKVGIESSRAHLYIGVRAYHRGRTGLIRPLGRVSRADLFRRRDPNAVIPTAPVLRLRAHHS